MTKLNGWKMGGAAFALCVATAIAANAQVFQTLIEFENSDGGNPEPVLVQGVDGGLFGTTSTGGLNGGGTVFKVTAGGVLTTMYNFCMQPNCADGVSPTAGLILADDGNFYGTTRGGGTNFGGTVFRITPGGVLTTLYSFCTQVNCSDGAYPVAPVIQGTNGNFYGTTYQGGKCSDLGGCGTVFKITPRGDFTSLYSFCPSVTGKRSNCPDGAEPESGLVQATDGNFYGTTSGSPICGGAYCNGTAYRITPAGKFTTLYSFGPDGSGTNPAAGLFKLWTGIFSEQLSGAEWANLGLARSSG